jgi:hypothetical protein
MGLRHASITKMLFFRQLAKPMFLLTPGSHMTRLLLDKSREVLDPAHLGSQFTKRHPQLFTHIMYNYDIYIYAIL